MYSVIFDDCPKVNKHRALSAFVVLKALIE